MPERLVEGEVVEDLDQLGIGDLEGRDVAGEQLVVVLLDDWIGPFAHLDHTGSLEYRSFHS